MVLLAAFVIIELRTKNPLLPMRVILERNRGGSFLSSFMVGAGLLGMFLFLTYYFQGNLGYSALKTGLRLPALLGRDHRGRRGVEPSSCPAPAHAR